MIIDNLASRIGSRLVAIDPDATVQASASVFSQMAVGLLIVRGAVRLSLAGVVSKSDIVRHFANGGEPSASLATIMTTNVFTCTSVEDLHQASLTMMERHLQNVPVLNLNEAVVGVLNIRDALEVLLNLEESQEQQLINYVAGVGYR